MDLALDTQRDPVDELGRPGTGRDDDGVERGPQVCERFDHGAALDPLHMRQHGGHASLGIEDSGLAVEHRDVAGAHDMSRVAAAQLVGVEKLGVEAVLAS